MLYCVYIHTYIQQARPAARGVDVYTAPAVRAAVEGASTANGQPVYPSVDGTTQCSEFYQSLFVTVPG